MGGSWAILAMGPRRALEQSRVGVGEEEVSCLLSFVESVQMLPCPSLP